MNDYYKHTHACLNECERIYKKIKTDPNNETTDEEDFFIDHFDIQLAMALIKDYGVTKYGKDELRRTCNIILSALDN